ncbi:hypothetical protein MAUB1S_03971 [Mycolicibacterium aubagnense]
MLGSLSLLDWNAEGVRTDVLVLPKLTGVSGVRASGYITAEVAAAAAGSRMRHEAQTGPVLSGEQRRFLVSALSMWGGVASGHPPPIEALGYADKADFTADVARLCNQLGLDKPDLSTLDWSRIQFLAEISWASDLFGAGVEFELVSSFTDSEALTLLRSVQRAPVHTVKPALVFPSTPPAG